MTVLKTLIVKNIRRIFWYRYRVFFHLTYFQNRQNDNIESTLYTEQCLFSQNVHVIPTIWL